MDIKIEVTKTLSWKVDTNNMNVEHDIILIREWITNKGVNNIEELEEEPFISRLSDLEIKTDVNVTNYDIEF